MVYFMNHILYGLHLFTQKFEPVVYHNGKVSYNAMLAKKFFLLMLMNYLLFLYEFDKYGNNTDSVQKQRL